MGTLIVRNLDDKVKSALRVRAARNSRSMEAEAREILAMAAATTEAGAESTDAIRSVPTERVGLGSKLTLGFAGAGGAGLRLPPRGSVPRAPAFGFDNKEAE